MNEEAVKASSPDVPFAPSLSHAGGGGAPLSSAIGAAAAGKATHSASFAAAAGDADPYTLLCTNPPHVTPSLAQRTHGTETLFQYYSQRGYKELLLQSSNADAAKAVQACLDGKRDSRVESAEWSSDEAAAEHTVVKLNGKMQPKNTHVIDRCLAEQVVGTPTPLRPPQAHDKNSLYLSQQADEERARATARRRAQLRQPPTEAAYVGRYYPPGVDVLPSLGTAASSTGPTTRRSLSTSLSQSAGLEGAALRNPGLPPAPGGQTSLSVKSEGRTLSLMVPLRTPEEVAALVEQQREGRRLLSQYIDEAFVAAYHARDPAAAQRQHDRDVADTVRRTSQAAAELLADDPKKKRVSNAAGRAGGEKKQRKSTVRATSAGAATAQTAVEGGVPTNLALLRSSLLLLSNEDGAVTLDQLCTMASDVPFNVPASSPARGAEAATYGGAMQKLFRTLHANTRAPNAADATDILLAVASTAAYGGLSGRQTGGAAANETSVSYMGALTTGGGGAGPGNNATTRSGNNRSPSAAGTARRAIGSSISSAAVGGTPNRGPRSSILGAPRGPASPTGTSLRPPAASVSFASNALSKIHSPGANGAWKEMGSPLGLPGRQLNGASVSAELKDSRKCVLVVELLDALDALLNSAETRRVVRWECFSVLAAEGRGYIHKSQLVLLRRHVYRNGSASEATAAVTASMVRALEDAFSVVAAEEEAAYVKANKKGRKGAAAGGNLSANQKSAIPLHMMRKSHMDFSLFCRFFDELPQMPAAFMHVWLPLLMDGVRQQSSASSAAATGDGEDEENSGSSAVKALPIESTAARVAEGVENAEDVSPSSVRDGVGKATAAAVHYATRKPGSAGDEEGFPLELLGSTPAARQAAVQQLLMRRMEQLQDACDALDKEKLHRETSTGNETFGNPDAAASV